LGHKDSVPLERSLQEKTFVKIDTNFVGLLTAPAEWRLTKLDAEEQKLINYGKELIAHTSEYLGPKGSVTQSSNGINCQNCHPKADSQP
jgi:thiosulfate dehydrogenase